MKANKVLFTFPQHINFARLATWNRWTVGVLALGIGFIAYLTFRQFFPSTNSTKFTSSPRKFQPQKTPTEQTATTVFPSSKPDPLVRFKTIHSNELILMEGLVQNGHSMRQAFLDMHKNKKTPRDDVVIAHSAFLPQHMIEHLMRHKRDSAIGVKYLPNQAITNMEGALHTFVTPLCPIMMAGDYAYKSGEHKILPFGPNQIRQVILSAAIHPDFECDGDQEVVMKIVEVKDEALEGKDLELTQRPRDDASVKDYDALLQKHMVFHLTQNHRLPAKNEIEEYNILKGQDITKFLNSLITSREINLPDKLAGKFAELNSHLISMEALFNIYVHQIRNEFTVLEKLLPQGYVYTIDPPSIFAQQIGGARVLNRLQMLAFKHITKEVQFDNLKILGFNDYADPAAVALWQNIVGERAKKKSELFSESGYYSVKEDYALILHNNSDAFGQNIEFEGPNGSMDGAIGNFSDAAYKLQRDSEGLLKNPARLTE